MGLKFNIQFHYFIYCIDDVNFVQCRLHFAFIHIIRLGRIIIFAQNHRYNDEKNRGHRHLRTRSI